MFTALWEREEAHDHIKTNANHHARLAMGRRRGQQPHARRIRCGHRSATLGQQQRHGMDRRRVRSGHDQGSTKAAVLVGWHFLGACKSSNHDSRERPRSAQLLATVSPQTCCQVGCNRRRQRPCWSKVQLPLWPGRSRNRSPTFSIADVEASSEITERAR